MKSVINCEHGSVYLRGLRSPDLPFTLAWRNRDDVRIWFNHKEKVTAEQHWDWWLRYLDKRNDYMFLVLDKETCERVGQVAIYNIDQDRGEAEIGRFIAAPGHSGKGYMRDAIEALSKMAFDDFCLRRLWLEVFKTNERAIRLYERCGFVQVPPHATGSEARILMERFADD